jgi:NADH:ubiquinone reductase (H+-translocating)
MLHKHKARVLIVGAGFGGTKAALELAADPRFAITLLSDDDSLRYYPTFYHTATGGSRANSSIPLIDIFAAKEVSLARGTANTLDRQAKTITTADGTVHAFDTLILGLGVVTNYFGIPGLADYSYGIKSQAEVERFKTHLHQQLIDDRQPDLNYVIIGAGPTGIELAGALPLYLQRIMKSHGIKHRAVHVDLIEALPRLLPRLPKDTSRTVRRQLKRLGVRLYLNSQVQSQSPNELTVSGKPIRSHTVVWTAGVTNHPFFSNNNFALMGHGKVGVNTYLQAEENIYVIGDNANTPYSGTAQTALRDGTFVAKNLRLQADGKAMKSYTAKQPITVIPAGARWAAVCYGGLRIYGWLGWALREIADLIGFHDYEPWQKAMHQYMTEYGNQADCQVCARATSY